MFGAGSLAISVAKLALENCGYHSIKFVVDNPTADLIFSEPAIAWHDFLQSKHLRDDFIIAVGYRDMEARKSVFERCHNAKLKIVNLVSNHAKIHSSVKLGVNNIFFDQAVAEHGVEIGNNNVIWTNAVLCHDTQIGNHNFFAAGAVIGGHCNISDCCFFGFNSVVKEKMNVSEHTLLGALSYLNKDHVSHHTWVGAPAKPIKEHLDGLKIPR
ncbi:MAG: hypothetical protein KF767_07155 [Bdellovibrionaceae bacterium]|nr:hypothetical protein [Pseudobdellovibrionaceae bacterium]